MAQRAMLAMQEAVTKVVVRAGVEVLWEGMKEGTRVVAAKK